MSTDDVPNTPARQAAEALSQLEEHGRDLCPTGTDPQAWAGDVLHDLARVAELLDGAVRRVSGKRNDAVAANASALATMIEAHRNIEVGAAAE